ncbi:MAG: hypothetical protein ACKVTZ_06020 [Bacteroidia bacterium]
MKKITLFLSLFLLFTQNYAQKAARLLVDELDAISSVDKGRHNEKGVILANQLLTNYPYSPYVPDAYYYLGQFYLQQDKAKAMEYYLKVLDERFNEYLRSQRMSKNVEGKEILNEDDDYLWQIGENYNRLKHSACYQLKEYYFQQEDFQKALDFNDLQKNKYRIRYGCGTGAMHAYQAMERFAVSCSLELGILKPDWGQVLSDYLSNKYEVENQYALINVFFSETINKHTKAELKQEWAKSLERLHFDESSAVWTSTFFDVTLTFDYPKEKKEELFKLLEQQNVNDWLYDVY